MWDWLLLKKGQRGLRAAVSPPVGGDSPFTVEAGRGLDALYRAGRLVEARDQSNTLLLASPHDATALTISARIALEQNRPSDAVTVLKTLTSESPDSATAFALLSAALRTTGRARESADALNQALALDPECEEALLQSAVSMLTSQRSKTAGVQLLSKLAERDSPPAEALFHLGNVHRSEGRLAAAESAYRQAVAARPGHVNALFNLGLMLKDAGNFTEARVQLERAVLLRNGWAPAHAALGALALDQREFAASVRHLAASIAADPRQPDVWYWLGNAHMGAGDAAAAVAAYRAAIRLDANHVKARWGVVMSQVPPVLALDEPAEKGVHAFGRELAALKGWLRVKQPSEAYQAVGAQQPYYLAYTEGNHRDSMREYGMLCTNLMAQWSRRSGLPKPTSSTGGRCRLGIVSSHLYDHSVWNAVVRGWVEHLDASKFEVHLFHTGHIRDSQTQWAITRVGRLHTISGNWQNSARAISDARMDVLLYPEIGMEATTTRLASLRLARLQMASWGHPLTTGLPTIDGYLSAEAFEPDQAQEHYSEKLHALPGLGCCYRPFGTRASPVDWSAVGLKSGQPFFLCAGTSFKYSPAHDALWVEVARRCRDTRLIFFRGQVGALSAQLELRLAQVFAQSGVDYARSVSFIEWQSQPAFFGLLEKCTAMLDSPGFSGFNTVMQAMECGTPVVAWEGAAMRSRFASGILRQIGLEGWVASDVESFASVAEGALSNQARHATRLQIGRQRQTLFNNKQPVDALGQLLLASSA